MFTDFKEPDIFFLSNKLEGRMRKKLVLGLMLLMISISPLIGCSMLTTMGQQQQAQMSASWQKPNLIGWTTQQVDSTYGYCIDRSTSYGTAGRYDTWHYGNMTIMFLNDVVISVD